MKLRNEITNMMIFAPIVLFSKYPYSKTIGDFICFVILGIIFLVGLDRLRKEKE